MLSTAAAAPLPVRRRPAAARLVPTSTGCSRGAEAYRFGRVSRAARCLLACERWQETPASSPSLPAAAGVRAGPPGSAKLGPRRGSSSSPPATSQHGSSLDGSMPSILSAFCTASPSSGKVRRARAGRIGRDGALNSTMPTSSPVGSPAAGLRGATLDGGLLTTLSTVSSASLLSLQPPPEAGAGRLASPALPTPTTCASARRLACGGPASRAARRERGQQAVQRSLTHSERR